VNNIEKQNKLGIEQPDWYSKPFVVIYECTIDDASINKQLASISEAMNGELNEKI